MMDLSTIKGMAARLLGQQPSDGCRLGSEAGGQLRRSIDAASGGRRGSGLAFFGPINSETAAGSEIVGRRGAYLAVNNPWASNGVAALTTYLAGTGARPTARNVSREQRRAVQRAFDKWAESADHSGRTDFWGLQALMARDLVIYGEALALIHQGDGMQLQVLPPDHLDRAKTTLLSTGGYIAHGVEFDAAGRRVAYWILPDRPSSTFTTAAPSIRVSAEDVLHVMHPLGPGQVRGLSWLAPVILTAGELDQLTDALLVSAKVAAMHAGFIKDHGDTGTVEWDGDTTFEPGALTRLPSHTDITFSSPDQLREAPALVRLNLQAIAAGLGLPEHLLSGDLTNANYSSLRAGLLPFRARMEQVQYATLVPQLLRPVWERWITLEVLAGSLDLPASTAADWRFPRHPQVDPVKDMEAMREALDMGLMSRRQAIDELGWNADDIDEEIAADREREATLGLSFTGKGAPDAA
ncbi:phage portal protein [Limimaricola sp.]|uniref:phage portal protein n=1 Tax=Limimaricola sp. TaxID=2211665 RepID=UPI0040599F1E